MLDAFLFPKLIIETKARGRDRSEKPPDKSRDKLCPRSIEGACNG